MRVERTIDDVRAGLADRRTGSIGLVPTMGALHDGHLALLRAARAENETVVMSLFVNPAQFAESSDLARYPRDEARDLELAARGRRRRRLRPVPRRDVPARLPDLGRRDRARLDPRRTLPPGPLPRRRDGRAEALLDRPPHARVLRPEGRPAGRGDPDADPRPRARGRAPRRPDRARPRRPRALVAQRAPLAGRASARPRALARARDARSRAGARRARVRRTASRSTTSRSPTSTHPSSPAPSASARPVSSTTSSSKEKQDEHPPAEARARPRPRPGSSRSPSSRR